MQLEPTFDHPEDAIKALVQEMGGSKVIASQLWPDKAVENASRLLNDCLNIRRPEKLDVSQIMMILYQAKEQGRHSTMKWIAGELGYEVHPITRREEMDRLTIVVEEAGRALTGALESLERIKRGRK